jgi:hypothetical protein
LSKLRSKSTSWGRNMRAAATPLAAPFAAQPFQSCNIARRQLIYIKEKDTGFLLNRKAKESDRNWVSNLRSKSRECVFSNPNRKLADTPPNFLVSEINHHQNTSAPSDVIENFKLCVNDSQNVWLWNAPTAFSSHTRGSRKLGRKPNP